MKKFHPYLASILLFFPFVTIGPLIINFNMNGFAGNVIQVRSTLRLDDAFENFSANLSQITSPPTANFMANGSTLEQIIADQNTTVHLTDLSTNTPFSWSWNVSPASGWEYVSGDSSSQNPSLKFTSGGIYSISLTATNGDGSNKKLKSDYIKVIPSPPIVSSPVTFCQDQLISPLTAIGKNLRWYMHPTLGSGTTVAPTPSSFSVGISDYYVSQTINGVESGRSNIRVMVNPVPSIPIALSPINYCQGTIASPLTAIGTNITWYTTSKGGMGSAVAPTPSTSTVGMYVYYVSQRTGVCESSRAAITVYINSTIQPSAFSDFKSIVCREQDSVIYSIPPVNGALSYTWNYSGTGVTFSSMINSVSIDFDEAATSGTLSVAAINSCGTSEARTLNITVNQSNIILEGPITMSEVITYTAGKSILLIPTPQNPIHITLGSVFNAQIAGCEN